ncbi:immune inhibitor A [Streptomyces bambusae]|uniref:M14 family metallopeptidase n=1 Tax=Streptomyces bambusae TaxID=1550616 RepID=UPI001CFD8785|nr:M14 family metallopeptidase [Streptomyces bambusae]MCB5166813.1 immune inhibitor A [Streptomyces bambusae]
MRHRARSILAASALVLGSMAAVPVAQAQPGGTAPGPAADEVRVYDADITRDQVPLVLAAGQDGHELSERAPAKGTARVELFLTGAQAKALAAQGVRLAERKVPAGATARARAAGDGVFRPYSGAGGLKEEIVRTAAANPGLAKVVSIGKSVKGQDILALKVTRGARSSKDGSKPSVLYMSNQHAREWITPEMTRRLMHHVLDGYGKDKRITRLVNTTELWFLLSANPDGYDYTHAADGERLWRKNMRDNDGDGKHTSSDGVDLNRNFAFKWGYDNEGSSPSPFSETYRGKGPNSEPETVALDRFERRIGFEYGINYHSAAELILYGVGWQVATPTPDDVVYKALAGTPEKPAVPGYHPQVSSELYVTNGDADGHAGNVNGIMMFTPEMTTCQTASAIDPNDAWKPEDCRSGFNFPDDEKLIQGEFAKNIPFALSVADSAARPDRPVSSVGMTAAEFTPDTFTTSYARGAGQPVAVTARKALRNKQLHYRVNGGRTHHKPLKAWQGGEVYGGLDNLWYDQYRGTVEGARPGDTVEVWFTGRNAAGKTLASGRSSYTVAARPRADVLVVAEEGAPAKHAQAYVDAVRASGRTAVVWDVATQGAPHALGVLSHFRAVVHHTGAQAPGGATQLALRDYLNEGGKLVEAGELAGGRAQVGPALTDDFSQYWLGAFGRTNARGATGFTGAGALGGVQGAVGDADGNPLNAPGAYSVTSDALDPKTFPQFRSAQAGSYAGVVNPYAPYAGSWMAATTHEDDAWRRLVRTVDLTGVTAADRPQLKTALNWNTEPGYDHAVLEAHTAGGEDWTTLPEASGLTTQTVPAECEAGFFMNGHPFLGHYLTLGAGACTPAGTSGAWNSFTGSSGGWKEATFDLSAYAGRKVELSLSYISDPGSGGRGLFADQTRLVVGGAERDAEGFETSLGGWTAQGAPAGSPVIPGQWSRSGELFKSYASVTTRDTVLLGFGLEHLPAAADRLALIGKALRSLRR